MRKQDEQIRVVKMLVQLQFLYIRYIERIENKCKSPKEIDNILLNESILITYKEAFNNLKNAMLKNCNNVHLNKRLNDIENGIVVNDLEKLRFGKENENYKFKEIECILCKEMRQEIEHMMQNMISISKASKLLDISKTTIKKQ